MEKWSVGRRRALVWAHHPEAPVFDTREKASAWLRDWLASQPEPIRSDTTLFEVRQLPDTE
jgi:hypothetical protein